MTSYCGTVSASAFDVGTDVWSNELRTQYEREGKMIACEGKITFTSKGNKTIVVAELAFEEAVWVWKVTLNNPSLAVVTVQFADLPAFIESLGDEDD